MQPAPQGWAAAFWSPAPQVKGLNPTSASLALSLKCSPALTLAYSCCWLTSLWPTTLLTSGMAFAQALVSSLHLVHPWAWLGSHCSTQLSLWRLPLALVWSQHTACHLLPRSGMDGTAAFREQQQQKWLRTEQIKINKHVSFGWKSTGKEKQEGVMMGYSRTKGIILKDGTPKRNRRKLRKGKSGYYRKTP